ncbi:vacuolar ATPase assembly integral membrane protein VMA21 homolog [Scaptodrosophila lebanonensis]|uniref:Vacuolar ATPase assembly integral membrane protein VMA21 homolog n=1 Tax=Drosophila lebanonensis TaxID=7225 RepID=A0A6J2U602_DROLE|nr:vacuolar ATPase assembly integral membrane protein VMA21 homolog [Scaptodrosophila lebanonensis]
MTNKNKKGNGNDGRAAKQSVKQRSEDSQDYSSLKTVLFYCSLIVFLPVATFFALKGFVLDKFFSMGELKVNIASAVGAVVALHLAFGLYIYRAYFTDTKSQTKQD